MAGNLFINKGGKWGTIKGNPNDQTDLPFIVEENGTDQRNKGDIYIDGELYASQGSVFIGNVSKKSTNNQSFETSNGSVYFKPRIESSGIGEVTNGSKEIVCYKPFTKDDDQGNLQPIQDDVLSSTYVSSIDMHVVILPSVGIGNVWVKNWYVRSATGFTNVIVQGYKGILDANTINFELSSDGFPKVEGFEPFFLSELRKDFVNGNGFSASPSTNADITAPLNNNTGYWQINGEYYTFITFDTSSFEYEATNINGNLSPYIKADGCNWVEINTSSKAIINGNLTLNGYNNYQLSNNTTEYFGCQTLLDAGVYDKIEVPYKNRISTDSPAYLYGIILDQNDNTIAHKRLFVGVNTDLQGSFTINFDEDILIEESGIYQIVIGRRNWQQGNKQADIFIKDVNSSDGSIWLARADQQNPSLNVDDTSMIDWSTIQKQNFNKIPKALIYKY